MAIEFHCDHCGKLVRTTNENAGKRGKCPHCGNSVYVPTPTDDIEPLRLAPLDEEEEREQRRLLDESRSVARQLREEKHPPPPETTTPPTPPPTNDARLPSDMETLVIDYVVCMSQGKLNEAEQLAEEIHTDMARAEEILQRLTMDELPPAQLAEIPRPVVNGFIKQLRESAP